MRIATLRILAALKDSSSLVSAVPRVPSSPLVKSIIPTFLPFATSFAIVAPQPNSTSSGCAPMAKISNFLRNLSRFNTQMVYPKISF